MNFYKIEGAEESLDGSCFCIWYWVWKTYRSINEAAVKEGWMWNGRTNWNPWGQTKSSKDEADLLRMRKSIFTWKNEPACVSDLLQLQWCRWNSGDPGVLSYGAGDVYSPSLGLVESTGGDSVVAGTPVPLLLLHTKRLFSTSFTMCLSYDGAWIRTSNSRA